MSYSHGLLDLKELSKLQIHQLFDHSRKIKSTPRSGSPKFSGLTTALLFFEASTRTRFSFETASARLGLHPLVLSGIEGTSLSKGETFEDTLLNLQAMHPEIFVIRCGDHLPLAEMSKRLKKPVINAGWGCQGHPTQALLDAFCWQEKVGDLEGQRLLIVGDVRHSRVASSHLELAHTLGYQIAFCGPPEFMPDSNHSNYQVPVRVIESLEDGISWATAVMVLRVQLERHQTKMSLESYTQKYQIGPTWLKKLPESMCLFHPGPVNYGIELDASVASDSRSMFMSQVEHGVWLRQALLQKNLEGVL